MLYVLLNMKEVVRDGEEEEGSFLSQFKDETWSGRSEGPNEVELETLLKEGAPGKKKFTSWFREKVISNLSLLPCNPCLVPPTNAQNNFRLVGSRSQCCDVG